MKTCLTKSIIWGVLLFTTGSCTRPEDDIYTPETTSTSGLFQLYRIPHGQHYSDQSFFIATNYDELKFTVKFDSTAVYTTQIPENQYDINKLYGFADNNAQHQEFSARIGWRWSSSLVWLYL